MDISVPVIALTLTENAPDFQGQFSVPVSALTLTENAPSFEVRVPVPVIALTLSLGTLSAAMEADAPVIALTLTANAPTFIRGKWIPASSLTLTALPPQFVLDPSNNQAVRSVYRCYLTGDDETPPIADLELPIASFQSTRRNAEQTYLFIVVPNPVSYIDGINARMNGDIVIYSGFAIGDTETLTELLRVNFESFRYDLGANSGSASLSGHKQVTYTNPKTRALSGVSYYSVTDGIRLARCTADMWLNPGDTADLGDGETFVVDRISYTINARNAWMEVIEVEA